MFQQRRLWMKVRADNRGWPAAALHGKIVLFKRMTARMALFRSMIGRYIEVIILEDQSNKFIGEWTGNVASLARQKMLEEKERQRRNKRSHRCSRRKRRVERIIKAEEQEKLRQKDRHASKPDVNLRHPRIRFIS